MCSPACLAAICDVQSSSQLWTEDSCLLCKCSTMWPGICLCCCHSLSSHVHLCKRCMQDDTPSSAYVFISIIRSACDHMVCTMLRTIVPCPLHIPIQHLFITVSRIDTLTLYTPHNKGTDTSGSYSPSYVHVRTFSCIASKQRAQVNGRCVTLGVPIRRPRPQLPPAPVPPLRSPTERELKEAALAAGEVDRKALVRVRFHE